MPIADLEENAQRFRSRAESHPHRGPGATLPPVPVRRPSDIGRT
jgi:hypothetical protein